jgi:hypothetical protein
LIDALLPSRRATVYQQRWAYTAGILFFLLASAVPMVIDRVQLPQLLNVGNAFQFVAYGSMQSFVFFSLVWLSILVRTWVSVAQFGKEHPIEEVPVEAMGRAVWVNAAFSFAYILLGATFVGGNLFSLYNS